MEYYNFYLFSNFLFMVEVDANLGLYRCIFYCMTEHDWFLKVKTNLHAISN